MTELLSERFFRELIFRAPSLLLAITFHEFAHARVALAFGDDTAQRQGRVTLNPLAHLDPIGTLSMMVGFFGWGRPVPVNRNAMTHPRADLLVSAAGPMSNLTLAIVAALAVRGVTLLNAVVPVSLATDSGFAFTYSLLSTLLWYNLILLFFNFLPIFPLDGSHMLENLLPLEQAYAFRQFNQSYGMMLLLGLLVMGQVTPFNPLAIIELPATMLLHLLWPG